MESSSKLQTTYRLIVYVVSVFFWTQVADWLQHALRNGMLHRMKIGKNQANVLICAVVDFLLGIYIYIYILQSVRQISTHTFGLELSRGLAFHARYPTLVRQTPSWWHLSGSEESRLWHFRSVRQPFLDWTWSQHVLILTWFTALLVWASP